MADLFDKGRCLLRCYTELAFLSAHVHFDQDRNDSIMFCSLLVNRLGKRIGIDGMNQMNIFRDILDFVALQMTDHMPTNILREIIMLFSELLNIVFTEVSVTCFIEFHDSFFGLRFTDRYDRHFRSISSASFTRFIDQFSDMIQICFQHNLPRSHL